jgi:hypothetical protein
MKSFLEFLSEDINLAIHHSAPGGLKLSEPNTLSKINTDLHRLSSFEYETPYIPLERVRKVLANFGLAIPGVSDLSLDGGEDYFPLTQYGEVSGVSDMADPIEKEPYHYLYFGWMLSDTTGGYEIHTEIITEDELEELNLED